MSITDFPIKKIIYHLSQQIGIFGATLKPDSIVILKKGLDKAELTVFAIILTS